MINFRIIQKTVHIRVDLETQYVYFFFKKYLKKIKEFRDRE